jgi:lipopolysaccharide biosynthesis regulator YciM
MLDAAADKMMKLVVAHAAATGRHRLNALAITRGDQARVCELLQIMAAICQTQIENGSGYFAAR